MVRDNKGEVSLVGAGNINRASSVMQTEAAAALKAIQMVAHLGMTHIILETDASCFASALRSKEIDRSPVGCLVRRT